MKTQFKRGQTYNVEVEENGVVEPREYIVLDVTEDFGFLAPVITTESESIIDVSKVLVYCNNSDNLTPIDRLVKPLDEDEAEDVQED